MCIHEKYSNSEKDAWLSNKGETLIAYKVVRKEKGKYYPAIKTHPYQENFYPKRMNKIKGERGTLAVAYTERTYAPYYHLFLYSH